MKNVARNKESGVALFFSIFALLLLTAIGAALIFMASTETSVNSNYRQEQVAYFAAKAGIEEARARMMASDPNTMYVAPGNASFPLFDSSRITQANPPSTANHMIYYVVNPGSGSAVQPWSSRNPYADDELCHDGYTSLYTTLSLTIVPPDVRCTPADLPSNTYVSYTSKLPFYGTSKALPYKWVRIAPKLNGSISYLTGTSSLSTLTYMVNPNSSVSVNGNPVSIDGTTPICWDGNEEKPLTTTTVAPFISNCSQMTSTAVGYTGAYMTNVYVVTALGVSSDASNAARKVVQAEVALQPTTPFPYGLYATSSSCSPPAISFTGTNPSTNSYTTANGGTYATTISSSGGDIGSNGSVAVQNGNIGGIVGVLQPPPAGNGTCTNPVTINSPGGSMMGTTTCPSGDNSNPPTSCYVQAPYSFQTPPPPSPLPPVTNYNPPSCSGGNCMVPGAGGYGNINVNGTLYLAPGTYNLNSLTMQGNGQIIVNPPGAVTLNIAGCANSTCASTLANPLTIAGNGITDDTIPNDFTINYSGSGTVKVAGNGNVTAILNAPNAALNQQGNGAWFGSMLVSTASIGGNAFFHYDRNAALAPLNNGYYRLIGYREVPY